MVDVDPAANWLSDEIAPIVITLSFKGNRAWIIREAARRLNLSPKQFVVRALAHEFKRLGLVGWEIKE